MSTPSPDDRVRLTFGPAVHEVDLGGVLETGGVVAGIRDDRDLFDALGRPRTRSAHVRSLPQARRPAGARRRHFVPFEAIAVHARDGEVVLRGTLGSPLQRLAAARTAPLGTLRRMRTPFGRS